MADKDETQRHFFWNEGMPTGPDVALICKTYPDLKPKDKIPYEDIAELLGIEAGSNRWRSVITAWYARMLNDHGLVIKCQANSHFYVPVADEIIADTHGVSTAVSRKWKKQRVRLHHARPETETQKTAIEHQGRLVMNQERESKKMRLNLLPNTKVPDVPRIGPPGEKKAG